MFINRSRSNSCQFFLLLLIGFLTVSALPILSTTAQAARFSVPIYGGNITVDNMGGIPQSRITWLVQTADDQSTLR